jgi:hypothetical protein
MYIYAMLIPLMIFQVGTVSMEVTRAVGLAITTKTLVRDIFRTKEGGKRVCVLLWTIYAR